MGFADAYLQKHAIRGPLISESPDPQLNTIIAVPAYNESGLTTCLDSLFNCDPPLAPAEVIVLINSAESSSREIVAANRRSYGEALEWVVRHRVERLQDKIKFHVVLVEGLPDKHFGAGLARKLVMDEAVRRLTGRVSGNHVERGQVGDGSMGQSAEEESRRIRDAVPEQSAVKDAGRVKDAVPEQSAENLSGKATNVEGSGIIVSLDADTVVRRDYLRAVEDHFRRHPRASGCSISFEHPLSQQEYTHLFSKPLCHPPEVFEAVTNYELHQRYYLLAVRYTGYPYAFHTVGSCFAVQVEGYCRAGGMSRRKAGEDFYFIQKVAMQGGFTECRSTRVYPSPRPSDRVPFGTGPDIARQIDGGGSDASVKHPDDRGSDGTGADRKLSAGSSRSGSAVKQLPPYLTYNPELFEHLREFFALIPRFYDAGGTKVVTNVEPGEAPENDPAAATDNDPPAGTENDPAAATDNDPPAGTENDPAAVLEGVPPLLRRYLEESGFLEELGEIRGNTASEGAFRKRFFNKLSMFRILKYLHYAEEHGVERMEVTAAAKVMLEMWEEGRPDYGTDTPENGRGTSILEEGSPDYGTDTPENGRGTSTREMLLLYRKYFG